MTITIISYKTCLLIVEIVYIYIYSICLCVFDKLKERNEYRGSDSIMDMIDYPIIIYISSFIHAMHTSRFVSLSLSLSVPSTPYTHWYIVSAKQKYTIDSYESKQNIQRKLKKIDICLTINLPSVFTNYNMNII